MCLFSITLFQSGFAFGMDGPCGRMVAEKMSGYGGGPSGRKLSKRKATSIIGINFVKVFECDIPPSRLSIHLYNHPVEPVMLGSEELEADTVLIWCPARQVPIEAKVWEQLPVDGSSVSPSPPLTTPEYL